MTNIVLQNGTVGAGKVVEAQILGTVSRSDSRWQMADKGMQCR